MLFLVSSFDVAAAVDLYRMTFFSSFMVFVGKNDWMMSM